jgi:hypothetical protein
MAVEGENSGIENPDLARGYLPVEKRKAKKSREVIV